MINRMCGKDWLTQKMGQKGHKFKLSLTEQLNEIQFKTKSKNESFEWWSMSILPSMYYAI